MKKSALFICLLLNTCILFAQSPTPASATPDSAFVQKPKKVSASDLKTTEGTSMVPANDITTNISKSKELSRFFNAIKSSGLNETFKSNGPITVFVPDNQAFNNLSQGKLDSLLMPEHKYDLIALVTYHAVSGRISAKDIAREVSSNKGVAIYTTLAGSKLKAKVDHNRNIVLIDENGDQCTISKFDIKQNNGFVHIISTVLIPRFKAI